MIEIKKIQIDSNEIKPKTVKEEISKDIQRKENEIPKLGILKNSFEMNLRFKSINKK